MSRPRRGPDEEPEQVLFLSEPSEPGQTVLLSTDEADHARSSLRLRTGDAIALVDGRGRRYHGHVSGLDKRVLAVRLDSMETIPHWPSRTIWLGVGVLRSTRMDFIIEKATELGVTRLAPLVLKRSVARPEGEGARQERWRRLAVEALKQSRRARLLDLAPPQSLEEFLAEAPTPRTLWVADPKGEDPRTVTLEAGPLVLVVGPEGGVAPEELHMLDRAGARRIALGGHRLRAETAVVTLVAAALATGGDLAPASSAR